MRGTSARVWWECLLLLGEWFDLHLLLEWWYLEWFLFSHQGDMPLLVWGELAVVLQLEQLVLQALLHRDV